MEEKVQGRSYTSNHVKLLKHLDKLKIIQDGGIPKPVMVHISPCNPCNLTCSFCCFANRAMKEMLTVDQMKKALDSFRELGASGVEFTGGGEPTLHPKLNEVITYAHSLGYKIGICTNGSKLKKIKTWDKLSWVRLGMYGFDEGYDYDLSVFDGLDIEISAAYVWDGALETSINPNVTGKWADPKKKVLAKSFYKEENFFRMLDWVEEKKIPTRIAFNAIKPVEEVQKDISHIRRLIESRAQPLKYAFLSDFNFKGVRRNDHCYMHMVKPCVFTDGNVYVCPSAELAPENNFNVNSEYKVCDIDGILDYYKSLEGGADVKRRHHDCSFCKYAYQNELVDDILTETKHNDFA
jgi:sulfatase maturation enzyme AslB (radical SAM superfamily)